MLNDYKPTHDPNIDTFKVQYLLGGSLVLAALFPYRYQFTEVSHPVLIHPELSQVPLIIFMADKLLFGNRLQILWAFSIWLESVAILPQLFMLQRTGEAETITTHYLFALGLYRALYIPNWLYRYFAEGYVDQIAWLAGTVQTILYSDFFWIYYTKYVFFFSLLSRMLGAPPKGHHQESREVLLNVSSFFQGAARQEI